MEKIGYIVSTGGNITGLFLTEKMVHNICSNRESQMLKHNSVRFKEVLLFVGTNVDSSTWTTSKGMQRIIVKLS